MNTLMPLGGFVKPQPRGQVTIPKKVRQKLNLNTQTVLNVFEEDGVIVMVPVKVMPAEKKDLEYETAAKKTRQMMARDADWTKEDASTEKYMKAVRYNPLTKLRRKRQKELW